MQTIKHTKWKDWNTKETWQAQLCQWVLVKCQSHRHQLGPCPRSFPSIGPAFSFLFGSLRSQNLMIRALPGLRQSPVVADVSVPREHVGQKPDVGKIRFRLKKIHLCSLPVITDVTSWRIGLRGRSLLISNLAWLNLGISTTMLNVCNRRCFLWRLYDIEDRVPCLLGLLQHAEGCHAMYWSDLRCHFPKERS